ncbi:DUF4404 family protein [Agaribacterium haliotis]|uniref:DUF4404 family protein n=1 Tax=Agaribacterium haliotis TaxID=2013869 RepID=UPI000BB53D49|nr:DUF4404 family protein [Agaribacterium haliotis]
MHIEELGRQLKQLQEELACLQAAEQHVQDKIDHLIDDLNYELQHPDEIPEQHDLRDLPKMLEKFETEHPQLTDSINRVMVTLSNMGI